MNPILKWAGGKRRMLKHIMSLIPDEIDTYIEPFFGGGALFTRVLAKKYIINDLNKEIMSMYRVVKNNPDELIKLLGEYKINDSEEFFKSIRSWDRDDVTRPVIDEAARTIYLNKAGYGGLFRVNSKGHFNVPFAKKINGKRIQNIPDIMSWNAKLNKEVSIHSEDFENLTVNNATPGDFVFLDPPYFQWSPTANFTAYTKEGFDLEAQKRLLELIRTLDKKGVKFMLTNAGTDEVKEFYKEFNLLKVPISRTITRKFAKLSYFEYIVTNY